MNHLGVQAVMYIQVPATVTNRLFRQQVAPGTVSNRDYDGEVPPGHLGVAAKRKLMR